MTEKNFYEDLATKLTMKVVEQGRKNYSPAEVEQMWNRFYKMAEKCKEGDSKSSPEGYRPLQGVKEKLNK